MTGITLIHDPAPPAAPPPAIAGVGRAGGRLRLLPNGDGWSLVTTEGALVYSALGLSGRRRCLEFARRHGVVALTS